MLFRVFVLRHGIMSMNRERYIIRTRRERDRSLSLIRKTRQSTRKFLPWDKGKSVQARDPFPVPTIVGADPGDLRDPWDPDSRSIVCHVPRESMSPTYDAPKECERRRSRAATTFPSWRHARRMSSSENLPWATFKRMHASTDFVWGSSYQYPSLILIMRK